MGTIYQWGSKTLRRLIRPKATHLRHGAQAEKRAARWLKQHGCKIITRNYACKLGEIDIIALDSEVLVFVEVRLRTSSDPLDSITPAKQQRIQRTAQTYLAAHPLYDDAPLRFDVMGMQNPTCGDIHWVKNAF